MNLVFFTHPAFLGQQSMPRYANMLAQGMKARGHSVEIWSPKPRFFRLPFPRTLKKWCGYIDQYIIFPAEISKCVKRSPQDTLFVFTDHALGPWVPWVAHRPHIIHCHDFMAWHSAQGRIPENQTAWTGRQYQKLIRWGYSKGKHFISVSLNTKEDLHASLKKVPQTSEIVYNGFHQSFLLQDQATARLLFSKRVNLELASGYVLHVGGNSWYKNRGGVIEIYDAWRSQSDLKTPLLLVGSKPSKALWMKYEASNYKSDIHWLSGIEDEFVHHAYSGASVFLFPTLGEGFGWPIAEAMASGCPVITTAEAPMTEVAGNAGFLIPRRPRDERNAKEWATAAAAVVDKVLLLSPAERKKIVEAGINNTKRFDTQNILNQLEAIYLRTLKETMAKKKRE